MKNKEIEKFEVYVTPLYDGNIGKITPKPTLDQTKKIIGQLIDGLDQLNDARKTHNDLKPGNILFRFVKNEFEIKIADFGQAGKVGGTPGWTAPVFKDRQPGKEDVYSMGLVFLWLLCESNDLFYALRDNFIEVTNITWLIKFRSIPEIQLVMKMLNR